MVANVLRRQQLDAPTIHNFRQFSRTFFLGYFQDPEEEQLESGVDPPDKSVLSGLRGTRLPSLKSETRSKQISRKTKKFKIVHPKEQAPAMAQFSEDLESFLRERRGKLGAGL